MGSILGSPVLDVAIGLIFVYLLLSVICMVVNEWIAGKMKLRATTLQKAITGLLDAQNLPGGATFLSEFYKHPLISGQTEGKDEHPSFLHAETFAKVLMDMVTPNATGALSYDDLEEGIAGLPDGDVKKALSGALVGCQKDIALAQKGIEDWFNHSMDRVSGWYKRNLQTINSVAAVVICIALNADTVHIVRTLWADSAVRSAVVEQAKVRAGKTCFAAPAAAAPAPAASAAPTTTAASTSGDDCKGLSTDEQQLLGKLMGWNSQALLHTGSLQWLLRIAGWMLSIIAISLGAPFWFDALKSIVNLRNGGKAPVESDAERAKS